MSLIAKNDFQILRGGVPGNYEGCHDAVLELNTGVEVSSGQFVAMDSGTGKYDLLTLTAANRAFYLVIEGNAGTDSYAGEFTDRAAGIKGTYKVQVKLDYVPALGDAVTVIAGVFAPATTELKVGEVVSIDAVSGIAIIDMY